MLGKILDAIDAVFIRFADPLLLIARMILAWWFGTAGLDKFGSGYAEAAGMMESHGIPAVLLPLVILLELGGAAFIALGLLTRLTCVALAAFTIAADLIFNTAAPSQLAPYLVQAELAIVAGFVALMAVGPGRWSLDAWRKRGKLKSLTIA